MHGRLPKLSNKELEFLENLTALAIRIERYAKSVMYSLDQPQDVSDQAEVIKAAQRIRWNVLNEKGRRRNGR